MTDNVSRYGRSQSSEVKHQGVPVSLGSRCAPAVWWSQVVAGSAPGWRRRRAAPRVVSAAGLSGRGWSRAERASGCPRRGCTPARGRPPRSEAPGSRSGTRTCGGGCRSRGSGRGAGSPVLCSGWFPEPKPNRSSTADLHRRLVRRAACCWRGRACCSACGSLCSSAGRASVWPRAALRPAATRPPLPGTLPLRTPAPSLPWAGGLESGSWRMRSDLD